VTPPGFIGGIKLDVKMPATLTPPRINEIVNVGLLGATWEQPRPYLPHSQAERPFHAGWQESALRCLRHYTPLLITSEGIWISRNTIEIMSPSLPLLSNYLVVGRSAFFNATGFYLNMRE